MLIRNLLAASLLALCGFAQPARAQNQFDGLDLSDDKPKKGGDKAGEKKPAEDGLDLSGASAPEPDASVSADAPQSPAARRKDEAPAVERDTTRDDRVKSVQRKLYLKRYRFELAPSFNLSVNDPYYDKVGAQVRLAWYPADSLAVALRGALIQTLKADDVVIAKRNLQSQIFKSEPVWAAAADLEWSPFYGKVAFLNSILHFDAYLIGGGGVVSTRATPLAPCFDLGVGMRFVAKDWLAVNVGLLNTTYTDTPIGTFKSSLQNMMMLNAGVSIFLPLKSTYREAE